jgi:hypothetical protein
LLEGHREGSSPPTRLRSARGFRGRGFHADVPSASREAICCFVLIAASVLFEVAGLARVVVQLTRIQRREFGTPEWWLGIRRRLVRLRGGKSASGAASTSAGARVRTKGHVGTKVRREPDETVESRLHAVEANLDALEADTARRFEEHAQRQDHMNQALNEAQAGLQRQQQERESARREELRESMTLQWWGTGLFLVGAILAGVANGVC